jgi:hypothetical protein
MKINSPRIAISVLAIAAIVGSVAYAQDMPPAPGSTPSVIPGQAANPPAAPSAPSEVPPPAAPTAPAAQALTQAQLDRLLAPIALYPDQLVTQILMAATYPLEVVEAARWVQIPANRTLRGDALTAALKEENWDPAVMGR